MTTVIERINMFIKEEYAHIQKRAEQLEKNNSKEERTAIMDSFHQISELLWLRDGKSY